MSLLNLGIPTCKDCKHYSLMLKGRIEATRLYHCCNLGGETLLGSPDQRVCCRSVDSI